MTDAPPIVVRDARDDERAAIAALTLAAYAEYATTMTPPAWAALEGAVHAALATTERVDRLVADRAGMLLGSVMLYHPASDAYAGARAPCDWPELRLLAVPPSARGLGVGPLLVRACIDRARAMDAPMLGLHSSRSMGAAITLYRRLGFERVPSHDFVPPGAEVVEGYGLRLRGEK